MTATRDPSALAADDRLAELAEILASGYVRALAKGRISSKQLAESAGPEAPCGETVNGPENRSRKEAT